MAKVKVGDHRRLGLKEALALLVKAGDVAREAAALIEHVGLSAEESDNSLLHARYELFDHISFEGDPQLPKGVHGEDRPPFPDEFKQHNGFPFGFVVAHALTIEVPSTTSKRSNAKEILAILGPGAPIGLFELFAHQADASDLPLQPWTIMAGTKNVFPLCNVVSMQVAKELNKKHQDGVDAAKFVGAASFADALDLFAKWRELHADWAVDVVFLSQSLVEKLGITKHPSELPLEKARLAAMLAQVATRRLSSNRSYFDGLWHAFKGKQTTGLRPDAFALWSRILASAHGHRTSYSLTETDDTLFPVKSTVAFLSELACPNYPLLTPAATPQDVRFLPVDEMVELPKTREVIPMIEEIRFAYRDAADRSKLIVLPEHFFDSIQMCLSKDNRANHQFVSYGGFWGMQGGKDLPEISKKMFLGEKWIESDDPKSAAHISFKPPLNALIKIDLKKIFGK